MNHVIHKSIVNFIWGTFVNRPQQYRPCKAFEVTFIKHKPTGVEGE